MAKQTFTTGQVLTAAQMTSLQQTAMSGGAASAKTASYTLVAADAGTAISMNNAGATTITVNTGLFAAGDTVHITNLGAGVCTITAGTATVNSSASLALAQYESGFLDFTSTSAAIFVKGAGAAASAGGMTLISTTTLSGASVSLSSIPATYNNLQLVIRDYLPATDGTNLRLRVNGDSTASRHYTLNDTTRVATQDFNQASWLVSAAYGNDNSVANSLIVVDILDYANTVTYKIANITGCVVDEGNTALIGAFRIAGFYNQTSAISSLDIFPISGNFTSGTALLYGVK